MFKVALIVLLSIVTFDVASAAPFAEFNRRDRELRRHQRWERRHRRDHFYRHHQGPRDYHYRDYRGGY